MKQQLRLTVLCAILLLAVALNASTLWFGTYITVNNTTSYSGTNALATPTLTPGNVQISDQGLTALPALAVNLQFSLDQTNWLTVAGWTPTATNAGTYPWSPGALTPTIYQRFQIVTTNSVNVNIYQP